MILSESNISTVWTKHDGYVYKRQPKFMTDSEFWILKQLESSGYVPKQVEQVGIELIKMEYILPESITDIQEFMSHYEVVLWDLNKIGIRHGDLTDKNLLIKNNKPIMIDFSESRMACDPRQDKRPEGDEYWLKYAMQKLCKERTAINGQ